MFASPSHTVVASRGCIAGTSSWWVISMVWEEHAGANGGDTKGGDAKGRDAKVGDAKVGDAKVGDANVRDTKVGDTKFRDAMV